MAKDPNNISVSDILGAWAEPNWDSGLIARCREAWNKALQTLSREELATLLRQNFAVAHLLPVAKRKLQEADDDTEMFHGELREAIEYASKAI
jgi:hypothetical protein